MISRSSWAPLISKKYCCRHCYCTMLVYVLFHLCNSVWSFWMKANLCRIIFTVCLYLYCYWRSIYQEGYPFNRIKSTTFSCLSQARIWIFNVTCLCLYCVKWFEVDVHFIDIGWIVDHHCLNFLFIGWIVDHHCLNLLFIGWIVDHHFLNLLFIGWIVDHHCLNFFFISKLTL